MAGKTILSEIFKKLKTPTGLINLKACKNYKNKFEQGMINEFIVEAVDLGDLEKIRIGHDNAGKRRGSTKQKQAVAHVVS